jgi:hypothetical protein
MVQGPVAEQPHSVLATRALVTALGSAPGAGVPNAAAALGWPGATPFGATRDRLILQRALRLVSDE